MTVTRRLVVNADDFGMSPGVNQGIIEAHERGIVTSASLMVRWPDAPEAARLAAPHDDLSVGLHIDLGEWVWQGEEIVPLYVVAEPEDTARVQESVEQQLGLFRDLTGHDPTHLDSHQHVHLEEPLGSILAKYGQDLGVPVRFGPAASLIREFYGQTGHGDPHPELVSVDHLLEILRALGPGTHELMCHPAYGEGLATPYRDERILELQTLCDPRIRQALTDLGIELITFADLASSPSVG